MILIDYLSTTPGSLYLTTPRLYILLQPLKVMFVILLDAYPIVQQTLSMI